MDTETPPSLRLPGDTAVGQQQSCYSMLLLDTRPPAPSARRAPPSSSARHPISMARLAVPYPPQVRDAPVSAAVGRPPAAFAGRHARTRPRTVTVARGWDVKMAHSCQQGGNGRPWVDPESWEDLRRAKLPARLFTSPPARHCS